MRAPEFWYRNDTGAKALSAILSPLGALYGYATRLRAANARPFRPHARVLCVGNLTAGGTGKTPIAMALASIAATKGARIVFLTRGYGGNLAGPLRVEDHSAAEVGDEPLLLARTGATVVARDRAAGAAFADTLGADVIVMDDGFQNFSVAKDISVIVVDGESGFGNGRLIPAGPLRESVSAGLARADALIVMGTSIPPLPVFSGPILLASLAVSDAEAWRGRRVFAFAGIGQPKKFFRSLVGAGAIVQGTRGFADHHVYNALELSAMKQAAERLGLQLVTTEKDYVRLPAVARADILPFPVHAVFSGDPAPLFDGLVPSAEGNTR